jgi:7-keto-8-aminopelargonate synthetase-like enzyme
VVQAAEAQEIFQELRTIIKNWKEHWQHGIRKKALVIFNGAYQANVTTLQTLGKNIPGLVFFSDERNHASIIEGIRGCKNEKKIFRHNDVGIWKRY